MFGSKKRALRKRAAQIVDEIGNLVRLTEISMGIAPEDEPLRSNPGGFTEYWAALRESPGIVGQAAEQYRAALPAARQAGHLEVFSLCTKVLDMMRMDLRERDARKLADHQADRTPDEDQVPGMADMVRDMTLHTLLQAADAKVETILELLDARRVS